MLRTKQNRPAVKYRYAEVWGLVLAAAAVFLALSLIDYDPRRNPLATTDFKAVEGGYTGVVGTLVAYFLYLIFGIGAFVIAAFLFWTGVSFIIRRPPRGIILKVVYGVILAVSLSCVAELQQSLDLKKWFPTMQGMSFGGVIGERIGKDVLRVYLGPGGAAVVAVTLFVISAMLLTRVEFYPYARTAGRVGRIGLRFAARNFTKGMLLVGRGAKALVGMSRPLRGERFEGGETRQVEMPGAEKVREGTAPGEKVAVAREALPTRAEKKEKAAPGVWTDYRLPPVELLDLPPPVPKRALFDDLKKNAEILEKTFKDFGIEASVGEIQRGPVVTRYEVHPAPGVKATRIGSLAEDIALALKVAGIRVTPPIPGKGAIGVEIPNPKSTLVCIREVLSSQEFRDAKAIMPLGIGKSVAGNVVVGDLAEMPHLLIAGATGSGKSVCINAILVTLLHKFRPDELRLLIVDPKKIELACYNSLPHLLIPVVSESKKVAQALNWLVGEMERRYDYLSRAGVRNIAAYNARPIDRSKKGEEGLPDRLPYIVTVIDELADLMMIAPVDVEMAITRLAQLSRSVGIHLIIATQRPSVNVITGVIKANFPARISFQVATKVDSRTVIDANGAETLVGNGDLLFMPPGTSKLIRAQGTFVSDPEIQRVVQFVKNQAGPDYQEGVVAKDEKKQKPPEEEDDLITDELFDQAVEIVLRTGQASASNLQRKMKIGYARAGRIIDMMEQRGLVGPADGSKPRKILIGTQDL